VRYMEELREKLREMKERIQTILVRL
jgi:hypothetical protein